MGDNFGISYRYDIIVISSTPRSLEGIFLYKFMLKGPCLNIPMFVIITNIGNNNYYLMFVLI